MTVVNPCSILKQSEITKQFFRIIQNKMHWAAHGKTAAEVICARADAEKPNMGMTSWTEGKLYPSKADSIIAKNYLTLEEIDVLNRIVTMYLDFAEMQAKRGVAMYMKDWVSKLDAFLKLNERHILGDAGKVSHEVAEALALEEYVKFSIEQDKNYISDFDREVKKLSKAKKKSKKR